MRPDAGRGPADAPHKAGAGQGGLTVREATGDDLERLLHIGRATFRATYEPLAGPDYVAMGLAKWWSDDVLFSPIRTRRCLVAELDGQVVGLATYGRHEGRHVLWKLYVLPQAQGRGAGTALLQAVEGRLRDDPLGAATQLHTSHVAANESTAAFYRRHGFTETRREAGSPPVPDQVWMTKELA